jgi:hypothetical protein
MARAVSVVLVAARRPDLAQFRRPPNRDSYFERQGEDSAAVAFPAARDGGSLIEDIGRAWSAARGIEKRADGARTSWTGTVP